MKKIVLMTITAALLMACGGSKEKKHTGDTDFVDSLASIISTAIADSHTRVYEGTLPGADVEGIRYRLALTNVDQDYLGSYRLDLTYIGADNGKDKTFSEDGQFVAKKGLADNEDAIVYHLVPDRGDDDLYLLVKNDSTLTLLGEDMSIPDSQFNYDLVIIR
ncbi:MAG: copper resistance protein NlpE [Bacteroides sp.]|nr:copper resistance protein NlpE [Bacteroides sp.]